MARRWVRVVGVVVIAAVAAGPGQAQSRRRAIPQPSEAGSAPPTYFYPQRGTDIYARPRGYDGTIRWNTPNADGNFGSASMGGGGGGGK